MTPPRRTLLAAGIAVALVGGVWVWKSIDDDPGDPHLVGTDARILVDRDQDREMVGLAGISGQLRLYLPDRCIVLDGGVDYRGPRKDPIIRDAVPAGRETWAGPIWPPGTTVVRDGDRYGARTSDGSTYWVGDWVTGGGGSWQREDDNVFRSFGLPQSCVGMSLDQFMPDGSIPQ